MTPEFNEMLSQYAEKQAQVKEKIVKVKEPVVIASKVLHKGSFSDISPMVMVW